MNRTLEAFGQAVFKRWFVDFEFPNEEGKPYKSSGGEMVASELGTIPKNWCVKKINDVLELAYGKALKETNRNPGKTPVYGSNGQIGWHNELLVKGPGIIVGRKGNPGTVIWSNTDFFPIDTSFYVVPKGSVKSLYYLLYVLKEQNLASLSADSAVPGLNRNIVYMNYVVVPSPTTLSQFDSIIRKLYSKVQNNNDQSSTLSQLRDKLLPRLMSGKIRVPVPKENTEPD
jgi:type I restriction enzyme S subunit